MYESVTHKILPMNKNMNEKFIKSQLHLADILSNL